MSARPSPILILAASAITTSALGGCRRSPPPRDVVPMTGRGVYDVSAIDVATFSTNPETRRRILYMPFGEAALRLGSMHFEATSEFEFTRGGDRYGQNDRWRASQDDIGSFEVHLESPYGSVDFYLVGEEVAVRQDVGKLRKKPRREVETETWTELAFASKQQVLELFRPRLAFTSPRPQTVAGRATTHYDLGLADTAQESLPPPPSDLPVGPPAKWRELAQPRDVKGSLWIDDASGVVLGLELEGRLEVPDREVRPTQLAVSYDGRITQVGAVEPIVIPEGAIAEYQRIPPPRDPLSFFADRLPQETP